MKKILKFITAVTVWTAIVFQACLITESMLKLLSYITILTNLLVAVCINIALLNIQNKASAFFWKSSVQTAITLYIFCSCSCVQYSPAWYRIFKWLESFCRYAGTCSCYNSLYCLLVFLCAKRRVATEAGYMLDHFSNLISSLLLSRGAVFGWL